MPAPMPFQWHLDYAVHLGFPTLDTPWLRHVAGSSDPVQQIALAAKFGFKSVADKDLILRPPHEQLRIGRALLDHGLALTSYVDNPAHPLDVWQSSPSRGKARLRDTLTYALKAGERAGARFLVITAGHDAARSRTSQMAILADHLCEWALAEAEAMRIRLCVEAISPTRLAGALITRTHDAVALAKATGGRLGIVYDTVHVAAEGDDLIETFVGARENIAVVQLADLPGRIEPGSGTLNLAGLVTAMKIHGFDGPVELEHAHSWPGELGERRSLARLATLDGH